MTPPPEIAEMRMHHPYEIYCKECNISFANKDLLATHCFSLAHLRQTIHVLRKRESGYLVELKDYSNDMTVLRNQITTLQQRVEMLERVLRDGKQIFFDVLPADGGYTASEREIAEHIVASMLRRAGMGE